MNPAWRELPQDDDLTLDPAAEAALASLEDDNHGEMPDWLRDGPESSMGDIRVQPEPIPYATPLNVPKPADCPEPFDFWGGAKLPAWKREYSPPAIADYIADQAHLRGIDSTMQAAFCLGTCASLIQSGIALNMQPEAIEGMTWREKPILWIAGVGEPGDGKGPAMDAALFRANTIEARMRKEDASAWERYDEAMRIHEKRLAAYYAEAVKNSSAQRPENPEKPPRRRLFTDDATKEAVAKILTENPRGKVTIRKMELASWVGSFGAYSNVGADKDQPDWLEFYESKSRPIDRVKDGASYFVESWGGCILGGIQPSKLAKIVAKLGDDGMIQRFMVIMAGPKRFVDTRAQDADAIARWNRVQDNLVAMTPRYGNTGEVPVLLSAGAQTVLNDKRRWIAHAIDGCALGPLRAHLAKWEGLFGRLMITAHCIADADAGRTTPSPEVGESIASQCWAWMQQILWPHALQFYGGVNTDEQTTQRKFAEFVLARQLREIRPGYLASKWSHYQRNVRTAQQRREFWDSLTLLGWLRPTEFDPIAKAGKVYEINPLVYDGRFAVQQATAERQAEHYRDTMPESFDRSES